MAYKQREAFITQTDVAIYYWYNVFIFIHFCVLHFIICTSPLGLAVLQIFTVCPFDYTNSRWEEVGIRLTSLNIQVGWQYILLLTFLSRSVIFNFAWSCDVPRQRSYGIHVFQLVRFARWCTSVLDFHFQFKVIFNSRQNYRYRVSNITSSIKHFEISSGHTLSFYPSLVKCFKNILKVGGYITLSHSA